MKGWPRKFDSAQDLKTAKEIKPAIVEARDYYAKQLTHSKPRYILGKIEILESRYFEKETDDKIQKELDKEWIEDLTEYPPDLIDLACKNWRRSDRNYSPRSAGVLMASVKTEYVKRKSIFSKAEAVLTLI